jgi:RNA-directed DNA polymerase
MAWASMGCLRAGISRDARPPTESILSYPPRLKLSIALAPPVRRVHIPKAGSPSETRPLGIPTFEDKILQRAALMVLEPVYETDFLDVSHGFRPGRGAHGALDALWRQTMKMGGGWIVDVDLREFFEMAS